MNKIFTGFLVIGIAALVVATALFIEQKNHSEVTNVESEYVVDAADYLDASIVADIPSSDVSDSEIAGLIQMREEEKLARDVYSELYDIWGVAIFRNIASSEQTHTDAVKTLLDRYGITDPVTSDERGVFTNPDFVALYASLVEAGSGSLVDALTVGATIEDLDIYDLGQLLADVDNDDIRTVYQNLERGSENHMRAFVRQLDSRGSSYSAQYISQDEVDRITR